MPGSRVRGPCAALAAGVLVIFVAAGAAGAERPRLLLAQANAPVKLTPPQTGSQRSEPETAPEDLGSETAPLVLPVPEATVESVPQDETAPAADDGQVRTGDLRAVDPDSVGVLEPAEGGFGPDMWAGTDRSLVERLLPVMPVRSDSVAMRDLARRLLLSAAVAPEGTASGHSLLALRAERLAAMGDMAGVRALLGSAPPDGVDDSLARLRVDSLFLAYDNAGACEQVRDLVRRAPEVYWQKAHIFCQALAGQHAGAALGLDLLREQGDGDDTAFFAVAGALAGVPGGLVESMSQPSALMLAMMRADRRQLPADVLASDEPAILRTVAVSPNAGLDLRLAAAERAEAMGALSPTALSQLYESVPFTEDELINALGTAETDYGARARALLYRAARLQAVPTARAEVLQRTWELARAHGGYGTAVRVNLPLLSEMTPASELGWFAGEAARALYAAGDPASAWQWFDLARRQATTSAEAAAAAVDLWPLARLASSGGEPGWDPALVRVWSDQNRRRGDGAVARAGLLYSLFAALGDEVGAEAWQALLDAPATVETAMPSPALWHGLRAAAAAGRVGETLLYALVLLGDGGPAATGPIVLNRVVASLSRVGLEADARALAVEAAIGQGL